MQQGNESQQGAGRGVAFGRSGYISRPTDPEKTVSQSDFEQAQAKVKTLSTRPANPDLLELYALFKQGSDGDVHGKRPGRLDFKGRFKYDAWAGKKGTGKEAAQAAYVAKVKALLAKDGKNW